MLWMIKFTQLQGELNWMNSWRKNPSWAVQGAAASSGGQWRKDSRNWGTCPLLKLFLGTAVGSWQRKTPGEMDFLIFLKLCAKEKLHFESQNVSFPLANLNLICFTTESTSVFRKHLKKVLFHSKWNILCFLQVSFFGFFSPFGKQNWHFCVGVTWDFSFSFLTPQNWLYSCSCPWEKSCLFSPCYQICY